MPGFAAFPHSAPNTTITFEHSRIAAAVRQLKYLLWPIAHRSPRDWVAIGRQPKEVRRQPSAAAVVHLHRVTAQLANVSANWSAGHPRADTGPRLLDFTSGPIVLQKSQDAG